MENNTKFILDDISKQISKLNFKSDKVSAGRIVSGNDGVILIEGMNSVKNNELLFIPNYSYAFALNLEENLVGAILLTADDEIKSGDIVFSTGHIVSTIVGEKLLGRIVDPMGNPIDGMGKIHHEGYRKMEEKAPGIFDRSKVNEPLYTGIKAIDTMIPIGKGQRELILGDRQTGKTSLAIDTIINQKDKNVICVYVSIGQKASTVSKVIRDLKVNGAMDYSIVVCSTADQSATYQYIAPYTATSIAEYFMKKGRDVLIVYDDLTKHAIAYRTISLLLKRPSGREAYPGDIFYIHSRLLERSAKLSEKNGGGSLTAFPIIETQEGDISGYIPTNVISITDGQIVLDSQLFNSGIRPAINVGLSVSRVGGSAQCKAIRKVSGKVRLDLAHFKEMSVFTQFGSELDESTQNIIEKGKRLQECFKQEQQKPSSMVDTVIQIFIASNNLLKNIEVSKVCDYLYKFTKYLHNNHSDLIKEIETSQDLTEENMSLIKQYFEDFGKDLL